MDPDPEHSNKDKFVSVILAHIRNVDMAPGVKMLMKIVNSTMVANPTQSGNIFLLIQTHLIRIHNTDYKRLKLSSVTDTVEQSRIGKY